MKWIYKIFLLAKRKIEECIIIFFLISGLVLSFFYEYDNFYVLQAMIIAILLIEMQVLGKYKKNISDLSLCFKTTSLTYQRYAKLKKRYSSQFVKILAHGFSFISNIFFFYLKLIPLNGLGIYICILLYITLYFSMIGYINVILFILFLRKVSIKDINVVNKMYPQNDQACKRINNIINLQAITFAVIGMIYTIVYVIIAPGPVMVIKEMRRGVSLFNIILLLTWSEIVLLIITGLFIILILSKMTYKNILYSFNDLCQEDIWRAFENDKGNLNSSDVFYQKAYVYELTEKVEKAKKIRTNENHIYAISFILHAVSLIILMSDFIYAIENIIKRIYELCK